MTRQQRLLREQISAAVCGAFMGLVIDAILYFFLVKA